MSLDAELRLDVIVPVSDRRVDVGLCPSGQHSCCLCFFTENVFSRWNEANCGRKITSHKTPELNQDRIEILYTTHLFLLN